MFGNIRARNATCWSSGADEHRVWYCAGTTALTGRCAHSLFTILDMAYR